MRDYIAQRQLTPRTATRFGLGAAPDQWDGLTRALTEKGYSKMELIDAGLAVAGKNGGIYDKFRARLMLPVIDVRGERGGLYQPHPAGSGGAQVPEHPGDHGVPQGAADLRPQLRQEYQAAQPGAGGGPTST